MTSLVAWVGADSRGPASLYLASDSRATWDVGNTILNWDFCRKLFIVPGRPDMLGYAGPIVLVSHTLAAVVDQMVTGYLPYDASPHRRFGIVCSRLQIAHAAYPAPLLTPYSVLYVSREGEGMRAVFKAYVASWTGVTWESTQLLVLQESSLLGAYGSGGQAATAWINKWRITDTGGRTSRSMFSGLCDAIASGDDPRTGGAPQLVGLYREGAAESFGVVWRGSRYFMGLPDALAVVDPSAVEWRNGVFERCDGATLDILAEAQRHARPRSLRG